MESHKERKRDKKREGVGKKDIIYIYIYIEREAGREGEIERE